MRLDELLQDVPSRSIRGAQDVEVSAVTADSRLVRPGSLFVAIAGFQKNGTEFIPQAIDKGAAVVVTTGPIQRDGVTVVEVEDTRLALAVIAANFYGRPAQKLELVGVTGTSGKTTTTRMLESVLDATGEPVGLIGTIEYRAGDERLVADRTTPDAIVLQEWFAKMVEAGVRRGVMEVSSHALSLKRTFGVPFAAAVFTNLSREHFDFHKDFEDYFAAKKILFDQIDRSKRTAVVNLDDAYGARLASELGPAALTFGRDARADVHPADGFEVSVRGLRGTVVTPRGDIRLESQLLGTPNLYNWLGAIGAAVVLDLQTSAIEEGVRNLTAVRGRFERVAAPSDDAPTVIVDYAHKPDALEKLLHAVRDLAGGHRIIVVFGCGGDRDRGKRPEMGEIAGRLADFTILTSDNPRSEEPERILDEIEGGMRNAAGARYERIADRRAAIERAIADAGVDDVVLIAGKGHETYQVVGDHVIHFDDREEAEIALKNHFKLNVPKTS